MSDFWDEAGRVLGKVAPILGAAVGGPIGGVAVKTIAGALGLGDDVGPQDIAAAVSGANPDQLIALKKADQDFQVTLKKLDLSAEEIARQDRGSAREREAQTKDWTPALLMMVLTIGFFTLLGFLALAPVPAENMNVLNIMLGVLGTAWTAGVTYYFGSSAGAENKDTMIKQLTQP